MVAIIESESVSSRPRRRTSSRARGLARPILLRRNGYGGQETRGPARGSRVSGRRFYQPETGRWVSRDPIGELEPGVVSARLRMWPMRSIAGERDQSLYVFTSNTPSDRGDALGELSFSTTVGPERSTTHPVQYGFNVYCGGFRWNIKLIPSSVEMPGWIIQEVKKVFVVKDCAGNLVPGAQKNVTYYEAWHITVHWGSWPFYSALYPEVSDGGVDEWMAGDEGKCSKGTKQFTADARYWQGDLPTTFRIGGAGREAGSELISTDEQPWFWNYANAFPTPAVKRTLKATWDCCASPRIETQLQHQP